MKTFFTSVTAILMATNLVFADFQYKGIRYTPTDSDPTKVIVAFVSKDENGNEIKYAGDIVIPEVVIDEEKGKEYTVVGIGASAFKLCKELTSVTLPNTIDSICNNAFRGTPKLTSLSIPSSVSKIGEFAFYGSGITSIAIPEGVERIEEQTFVDCKALKEIEFPSSLNYIGLKAFNKCKAIEKFTCKATVVPTLETSTGTPFGQSSFATAELHVPAEAVEAYKATEIWKGFESINAIGGATSIETNEDKAIFNQAGNVISFVEPTNVVVYNLAGGVIFQGMTEEYIIPSAGMYIIHTSKGSFKVMGK